MRGLREVVTYELETALRSRRLLLTLGLVLLIAFSVTHCGLNVVVDVQASARGALTDQGLPAEANDVLATAFRAQVITALGESLGLEEGALRPVITRSYVLPILLFFAQVFLPFLVFLVAFDLFSGDLSRGSLRYSLVRTSRRTLVAGKVLATSVTLGAALALGYAGLLVMSARRLGEPTLSDGPALVLMGVVLIASTLPWVALCAVTSTLVRQPLAAMVSVFALYVVMRVLSASWLWDGALGRIFPLGWNALLWKKGLAPVLVAIFVYAAFACVFVWVAEQVLRRREL